MNIRYLQNHEIDMDKWDDCVAHSFNGLVYAYSWYLDAICEDWHALVDDDYERIFPMVVKRKFGVDLLYQPFFTQQLGVFSRKFLDQDVVDAFVRNIPSKFKYIEFNLNVHNKIDGHAFKLTHKLNLELDIINSYDQIKTKYSKNLQRNLKKADNEQLSINKNANPDEVIQLFRQNNGQQYRHILESDYLRFKRMLYAAIYKGMVDVYGVYDRTNDLCAGAVFIRSHNRATFLFSGINASGKEAGAMPFLLDAYIREHAEHHLTFDFEGSNNESLARFYKGFGAQEVWYSKLILNRMNYFQKMAFKWHRKLK